MSYNNGFTNNSNGVWLNYAGTIGWEVPRFPFLNLNQYISFTKAEILTNDLVFQINPALEFVQLTDTTPEYIKQCMTQLQDFFDDLSADNHFREMIYTMIVLASVNGNAVTTIDREYDVVQDRVKTFINVNISPSMTGGYVFDNREFNYNPIQVSIERQMFSSLTTLVPQIWEVRRRNSRYYVIMNNSIGSDNQFVIISNSQLQPIVKVPAPEMYLFENQLKVIKLKDEEYYDAKGKLVHLYPFGTGNRNTFKVFLNKDFQLAWLNTLQLSDVWQIQALYPLFHSGVERVFNELNTNITQRFGVFSPINTVSMNQKIKGAAGANGAIFQSPTSAVLQTLPQFNQSAMSSRWLMTSDAGESITAINSTYNGSAEMQGALLDPLNFMSKLAFGFDILETQNAMEKSATEIVQSGQAQRESIAKQLGRIMNYLGKVVEDAIFYEFGQKFLDTIKGFWTVEIKSARNNLTAIEQDQIMEQVQQGVLSRAEAINRINPNMPEWSRKKMQDDASKEYMDSQVNKNTYNYNYKGNNPEQKDGQVNVNASQGENIG